MEWATFMVEKSCGILFEVLDSKAQRFLLVLKVLIGHREAAVSACCTCSPESLEPSPSCTSLSVYRPLAWFGSINTLPFVKNRRETSFDDVFLRRLHSCAFHVLAKGRNRLNLNGFGRLWALCPRTCRARNACVGRVAWFCCQWDCGASACQPCVYGAKNKSSRNSLFKRAFLTRLEMINYNTIPSPHKEFPWHS